MIDYLKIWVENVEQINKIVNNPAIEFIGGYGSKTGLVIDYPSKCEWNWFKLELKSRTRLEITGSLHHYWNNGTNENDFKLIDIKKAIKSFCKELNLNPILASIINLEIGVNISPSFAASDIIEEIICYKNKRPLRPYEGRKKSFFFIEFQSGNHYLKVYDKGKQYETVNILRIEFKIMRTKELKPSGVHTLNDLSKKKVLQVLGRKLMQFYKGVVFTDSSIETKILNKKDKILFDKMSNPNKWIIRTGRKNTTRWRKEERFIEIVKTYGEMDIYRHIETLMQKKITELLKSKDCIVLRSKYNRNLLQKRFCRSCGKDITNQKKGSLSCSKQCRNNSSNPRNNFKNKIKKITGRGLLFDIIPFIVTNNKKLSQWI